MKKNTILLTTLFAGLLAGTAGNTQDSSKCKTLQVKKNSGYAINVTFKDCTGHVGTETINQMTTEKTYHYLSDPSPKPENELKIDGVGLLNVNPLWKAPSAGDGWTVNCFNDATHPQCQGTPIEKKNCKSLTVKNDGVYIAQVEYTECQSKVHQNPQLWKGYSDTYLVEPNTDIRIMVAGTAGRKLWPESQHYNSIGNGYTITCSGDLIGGASCNAVQNTVK